MEGSRIGGPARTFLLECFWPGVTEAVIADASGRARRVARELGDDGHPTRYLGSQFVPGDEVVFFEVEADSEETVRALGDLAGIPYERVVGSVRVPASRQGKEQK
jgi:hypothetical protein